jgi:hypothetical protein
MYYTMDQKKHWMCLTLSLLLGLKHNEDAWPMIPVHCPSPTYIKVMSVFAAYQGSLYADYLNML